MTTWFAWFVTGAGNKSLGKHSQGSSTKSSLLSTNNPLPRKWKKQEIEIYLQEHYQTKVKPLIDSESSRHIESEGMPLAKRAKLKLLKTLTKEAFDLEEQEIKDNITMKALNQPNPYPPKELEG